MHSVHKKLAYCIRTFFEQDLLRTLNAPFFVSLLYLAPDGYIIKLRRCMELIGWYIMILKTRCMEALKGDMISVGRKPDVYDDVYSRAIGTLALVIHFLARNGCS